MQLMQASHQWMSRPDDERFTSLTEMLAHFQLVRSESRATVVPTRRMEALPAQDNKGLSLGVDGKEYTATHHSFGQVAQLAESPAGYLRTLPSPIAADCINYGLQYKRGDIRDVGVLLRSNGEDVLRAATGPNYGRIWNADIVEALIGRVGDGVTGAWRVPGEFGREVQVNKSNTTLYASDRDMFVFLADETNRIDLPERRNGQGGTLSRGFFLWNSEVGDKTFGLGTFLFDYVCQNRIVWGAEHYAEVRVRHTASAPDRFLSEMQPALEAYANASSKSITEAIDCARKARVDDELDDFLAKRFGRRMASPLKAIHEAEEGRPIETLWDVATAATAYARSITHQDQRVAMEREAGKLIKLAAWQ